MEIIRDMRFRRRAIFLLANVSVLALLAYLVIMPLGSFFVERDSHISDQRRVLARLSAVAAQGPNIESIVSDTNAQMRAGEFLSGQNENVISADLQTRLKALVETGGARSRAAQALPIKTVEQVRYSGSRIEIVGSLQSIQRAVYAIENAKPYLFISGASIKMTPSAGRPAAIDEPSIQAHLDVFGAIQINGREP